MRKMLITIIALTVLAGGGGDALGARKPPILHLRNVSYMDSSGCCPGSGAVVEVNLPPRVTYTVTVAMTTVDLKTFNVRKTDILGHRACQAFHASEEDDLRDSAVQLAGNAAWQFTAFAGPSRCRAKDIDLFVDLPEPPGGYPEQSNEFDRSLEVTVKRGTKTVAVGRYTVHYFWDENATYRIWDSDFDGFVNTCINGNHTLWAEGGRLYCVVSSPAWYLSIKKRLAS